MKNDTPRCQNCGNLLDRIDHYGIEHTILRDGVYREVLIADGAADGSEYGMASETDLRCAYCGESIRRQDREYFYRRWIRVQEATAAIHEGRW
jgi:hypothetical protein